MQSFQYWNASLQDTNETQNLNHNQTRRMRTFKNKEPHTEKIRILYIPSEDSLTESNIIA